MTHARQRATQRGASTLVMALVLLLVMAIVAMYTHRSLWFEQQASNNQVRAIRASELAQAGLAWTQAQLNNPRRLAPPPSCAPSALPHTGESFRERYLHPHAQTTQAPAGFAPTADRQAHCALDDAGQLSCLCPDTHTAAQTPSQLQGGFHVTFAPVAQDPLAVEVLVTACSGPASRCSWSALQAEASAQARGLVKLAPALPRPPAATVVMGGNVTGNGRWQLETSIDLPGVMLARAGGSIGLPTQTSTTPDHTLANDPVLQRLRHEDATGERFFAVHLGRSTLDFRNDPLTATIGADTCTTPTDCGLRVLEYQTRGFQQFWIEADAAWHIDATAAPMQLGSTDKPLVLATFGRFSVTGPAQIHGLILAGQADFTPPPEAHTGTANLTLEGALVVLGDMAIHSGLLGAHLTLRALGWSGAQPTGVLAPVPGSWRDRHTWD